MNEDKKDFNAMLFNKKDLPKITEIKDDAGIKKWGGRTLVVAPPTDYDKYMRQVPKGKLILINQIRKRIASDYKVDVCCPLTAGIFVNICAWASYQRTNDKTPYWRVLKANGALNEKYPNGVESQKSMLMNEGFTIIEKGIKNKQYFVKNYEEYLFDIN